MGERGTGRPRQLLIASLTSAQLASLSLGIGAGASCDKADERNAVRLPPSPGAEPPVGLDEDELTRLRERERQRLEEELRPEVIADLRRSLAPEVKAQLLAELRASSGGTAQADAVQPAAPADGGPGAPLDAAAPVPAGDDIWTTPGTRIWPSAGGLKLVEHVVAAALDDKLPADVRLHYPNTPEILYCYSVFENPLPDTTVTHVWRRGSRLVSRVELEVGRSPKWRTWSKQRTQPHWTGLWSCEVLGPDGQQLGLTVFQIGG